MDLKVRRWQILFVACCICLCSGSMYAWSVFATPLAARLTEITGEVVTTGMLAATFSLANGLSPIPMILGGFVNDRIGPRWLIASGGLLIGLGYIAGGLAQTPMQLILGFGLSFGIGLGFVYGAVIGTVMKFFPDRRGLVGGLVTGIYGLSSVILSPVAHALIDSYGVHWAMIFVGAVFALVIVSGAMLMQKCPDDFLRNFGRSTQSSPDKSLDWRAMLSTKRFYQMIAMLVCGVIPAMMFIPFCFALAKDLAGLSSVSASIAVSVLALSNVGGRFVAGAASDRFGRVATLSGAMLVTVWSFIGLSFATPELTVLFWVAVVGVGLAFGAFMAIYPGFTSEEFGSRHNSVNYGIMFSGFAIAGFAGPGLLHAMQNADISLSGIFLTASALCCLGLVFAWLFEFAKKRS